MSHSPYGPSPFDEIARYRESKEARRQAAQDAMSEHPRSRAATAIVVTKRPSSATVQPIVAIDFCAEGQEP